MNMEANLKRQIKAQDKIQMSAANLELPQVKSSKELLRKMQIKREKMTNKECTTAPTIAAQRQVYLPNLKVSDMTNLDRRFNSTKKKMLQLQVLFNIKFIVKTNSDWKN